MFSDEQEEGALETAGGIIKALPLLSETFLVVNGDVWTDYSYESEFELNETLVHLVLVANPEHNPSGDFELTASNEKFTFSGIAYYSKEFFQKLSYGKQALAPLLFEGIEKNSITTSYHSGVWHDIGTPERLEELEKILLKNA
jgi:MurNAc alpha-1-phosphate uridylyltransferase